MWRALRTELVYFVPWLLGGLGIATFVVVVLSVLLRFLEEGDGPPVFVAAMLPVIAGMVVSFIAQSYRTEERRSRLLLAGPLTPRQLAGVKVLLPPCFVGLGVLATVPMMGIATLIAGTLEASTIPVVTGFAAQFLAYAQLGPLAQESVAARRQGRPGAAIVGWASFAAAILILAVAQLFQHLAAASIAVAAVVIGVMVIAAVLYDRRTDFTR